MTPLIERGAIALLRKDEHALKWSQLSDYAREPYLERSRICLEAFRKPTEKMVKAGADKLDVNWGYHDPDNKVAKSQTRDSWRAMIDTALAEKEPGA